MRSVFRSHSILLVCGLLSFGCSSDPNSIAVVNPNVTASTAPDGGPLLIHEYDGGATDSSGNGLDGIIFGDARFRPSCLDRALVVDGDDDYVQIPFDESMQPQTVTLEVYFRPQRILTDNIGFLPIVVKMPVGGNFWNTADGYDLWYQDSGYGGRIGFGIASSGGTLRHHASWWGTMRPNKYYHLVGTYDGSEIRLYLDGALVAVTPHSAPIAYLDGPIWVGGHIRHSYYGGSYHDFEGAIDEVVVYDYVLRPEEIRERSKRCSRNQGNGRNLLPQGPPGSALSP